MAVFREEPPNVTYFFRAALQTFRGMHPAAALHNFWGEHGWNIPYFAEIQQVIRVLRVYNRGRDAGGTHEAEWLPKVRLRPRKNHLRGHLTAEAIWRQRYRIFLSTSVYITFNGGTIRPQHYIRGPLISSLSSLRYKFSPFLPYIHITFPPYSLSFYLYFPKKLAVHRLLLQL